jgi:uncharacterized protein YkwD
MTRRFNFVAQALALLAALWALTACAQPRPVASSSERPGADTSSSNRCSLPHAQREQAQRLADEINLLRTQPSTYADIIERAMSSMDARGRFERAGFTITSVEGRAAVNEAVAVLRRQRALPPLGLNDCLSFAALGHAQFLGRTGDVGHVGAGGSNPAQRAARALGVNRVNCGETVSAGPGGPREHVIALVIDDDVADRGHRKALLDADYRSLGVGHAAHRFGSVSVQKLCQSVLPR